MLVFSEDGKTKENGKTKDVRNGSWPSLLQSSAKKKSTEKTDMTIWVRVGL